MTVPTANGYLKEKDRVAERFNRAASRYDQAADFQQTVAERLLERLQFMKVSPQIVLDLGSGTGRPARMLERRFARARVFEMDLALHMLRQSRPGRLRRLLARRAWVCADAERLPLRGSSVDLVFSNLMLQWCDDPERVFREALRVLRPRGLLLFSTLGPDTLIELRESWSAADDLVHVNAFYDMHDLGDALVRAGLHDPVMEVERFTLCYSDGLRLMRDLQQIAAQNANLGRRRTLTGKGRLRQMLIAYETRRKGGFLPATYEVIYGHAWGGGDYARRRDQVTAVFPVEALRRRGRSAHGNPGAA